MQKLVEFIQENSHIVLSFYEYYAKVYNTEMFLEGKIDNGPHFMVKIDGIDPIDCIPYMKNTCILGDFIGKDRIDAIKYFKGKNLIEVRK